MYDRERARIFAQALIDEVFAFSSAPFQLSVWVRGDHPEKYVQDYVEAINVLHDYTYWLLDDAYYRHVPFTDEQAEEVRRFAELVERFDESLTTRDAEDVIADPRWPLVRAEAARTLDVLSRGGHGLRPQVVNP
jgi:hypothetical protein